MDIIVDRKKKRFRLGMDENFNDPLGTEKAKREKARTIDVPNDSDNPVHKFIKQWGSHKLLLGKKVHCLTDKQTVLSGYIVDVIAPHYLMLRNKGVATFESVITIEGLNG